MHTIFFLKFCYQHFKYKVTVYKGGKPEVIENDGTLELTFECGDGFFVTVE